MQKSEQATGRPSATTSSKAASTTLASPVTRQRVERASLTKNVQTPAGLLPSGTIVGKDWEIYVSTVPGCLTFKRADWTFEVEVPFGPEGVRSFVLA